VQIAIQIGTVCQLSIDAVVRETELDILLLHQRSKQIKRVSVSASRFKTAFGEEVGVQDL
jgi:hypothetical protein